MSRDELDFKFANPLTGDVDNMAIYWILVLVIWAFVEASALGLIGGLDSPFNKAAFDDHKQTLVYRMGRVEELTGRNLRDTADVVQLWMALEALQLTGERGEPCG